MKCLIAIITVLLSNFICPAQKVYKVKYESQADLKIFPVKYESQCDLKVFWVEYESQADLKIFYVDYKSQAGWKNKDNMHLLKCYKKK